MIEMYPRCYTMDMHLPYTEPLAYRSMYAGDRPDVFKSDSSVVRKYATSSSKMVSNTSLIDTTTTDVY